METLAQLKNLLNQVADIQNALALLDWDQQVCMPPGGTDERADTLATLYYLYHGKATSPEIGQLLEDLRPLEASLDPDKDDARLIRKARRNYEKQSKVSAEWVAEFARTTSQAFSTWQVARQQANFALFQPLLEKIVALRKEYSAFFAPYTHIYDPQLDDYEPGMKTGEVQAIFNQVRPVQVGLIQEITAKATIDDTFLLKSYDEQSQWDFGVEVITKFGYDWNHGRIDKSAHPFTQGFGPGDVRITTRIEPQRMASAIFGTMHEAGHALYDQGIDPSLRRSPLGDAASMAVHESQSRLWENLVGRSLAFWRFFYPRFQAVFPAQAGEINLMTFYRAINKVQPSFIRVEADEATYNLHIMLRLEIEIALLEGSLEVRDLPTAWNQKMQEYLGVLPSNDALGVLQDVHWSNGLFGYFPAYALGNLVSAQLWEVIQKDLPDLETQISQGKFSDLLAWLRSNVHNHGARYEPQQLVEKITGSRIDPAPYLRYLLSKYGEIYQL